MAAEGRLANISKVIANMVNDFSKLATRYDIGLLGRISRPFYAGIESAAASYLTAGTRVLDVGAGTGALLTRLVTKFDVVGTGIDPSPQMTQIAQLAHPDLRVVSGEAEALPFPDNSFDVVIACLSYHHMRDPQAFVAEALRVLMPSGTLLIAEPALPQFLNTMLRLSARLIPHDEVFQSPSSLTTQLHAGGLTSVRIAYRHRFVAVVVARKALCRRGGA